MNRPASHYALVLLTLLTLVLALVLQLRLHAMREEVAQLQTRANDLALEAARLRAREQALAGQQAVYDDIDRRLHDPAAGHVQGQVLLALVGAVAEAGVRQESTTFALEALGPVQKHGITTRVAGGEAAALDLIGRLEGNPTGALLEQVHWQVSGGIAGGGPGDRATSVELTLAVLGR